jgi:hypothetical protein
VRARRGACAWPSPRARPKRAIWWLRRAGEQPAARHAHGRARRLADRAWRLRAAAARRRHRRRGGGGVPWRPLWRPRATRRCSRRAGRPEGGLAASDTSGDGLSLFDRWAPRAAGCRGHSTPPGALRRRLSRPSHPGCCAPQAPALTDRPLRCAAGFFGVRALAASRRRLPRTSDPRCVAPQAAPAPRTPSALRRRLPRSLTPRCVAPQASTAREPRPPRAAGCRGYCTLSARFDPERSAGEVDILRQGPTRARARRARTFCAGPGGRCAGAARPARPRARDRGSARVRGQTERAAGRTLACALRPR